MGANQHTIVAYGNNVQEEFNKLSDRVTAEYGYDSYNGTISTTSLGREITMPSELKKAIEKGDWNTVDKYNNLTFPRKWETQFTKELDHYKAYTPKWVGQKETAQRKKGVRTLQKFSVVEKSRQHLSSRTVNTLTEAKRNAKELALKKGADVIVRQHRSDNSTLLVGTMRLESDGKKYKSARSAKTKTYLPTYKIEFFVYASE